MITNFKLGAGAAVIASLAAACLMAAPASASANCASPQGCSSWTSVHNTSYSTLRAATPVQTYNSYPVQHRAVQAPLADHPAQRYAMSRHYNYQNISAPRANMVRVPCQYTVDVPIGGRVIDCYAIAKPRPVVRTYQHRYQVVRPIIYVHYPVFVPPAPICGAPVYHGCR